MNCMYATILGDVGIEQSVALDTELSLLRICSLYLKKTTSQVLKAAKMCLNMCRQSLVKFQKLKCDKIRVLL